MNPPIICTDDGWVFSTARPPISVEEIKEKMVDVYAGTPTALWWSVGDHEIYNYETKIGELVGEHPATADQPLAKNIHHLIETTGGPLTTLIQLCREAQLPFFPRVRMNSHYDIEPADPGWGRFRTEHPELMIGMPDGDYPVGSLEHGIRTGLNFAFPQVREHRAAIICELFEHFDVDGVELDFMRHPAFFRIGEAYQHRHLMTDLLRHVRGRMQVKANEQSRDIQLAVRVPPTLADSARIGLDVAQWMRESLVDIVVVGGGFIPYETPIGEFAELAGEKISLYGCIESTRYADERNLRAIASHFWNAGADGVYLYNFYTTGPEWNRRVLNQLADPAELSKLDKRFELDQTARFTTPYHCAFPVHNIEATFRYANPATQLPVTLRPGLPGTGDAKSGVELQLNVVDDVGQTQATCTLFLRFDGLSADDQLIVLVNGRLLAWDQARVSLDGWMRQEIEADFWNHYPVKTVGAKREGESVEWEVDPALLKAGMNQLAVALAGDEDREVWLKGVELLIEY